MLRLNKTFISKALLTAGLAVSLVAANASSAQINYGDFSDIPPGTVTYGDVTESSFSDAVPLYGLPDVSGNLLDFDPTAFGTSSVNGDSSIIDGQINFTIAAESGTGITSFVISESGDFGFSGVTPTAGAFVGASAGATVSILEVDGVALTTSIDFFVSNTFSTDYTTEGGAPVTGLLPWSLTTIVDLTGELSEQYVLGATLVEVAIDNQLTTGTTLGSTAAIAKKDFRIVTTTAIPEPSSLALLGLGGLLVMRRQRDR